MSAAPGPGAAQGAGARHARAFTALFLVELWERFGFYGTAGLLVLFMAERQGMPDHQAVLTFGAFSALVYGLPAIGGWLGDRVLGAKRTMVLGALLLAAGYFALSLPFAPALFPALGLIAIGNGLFKVNPNHLVSRLYADQPARLDGAFTLYYMAVNIGAAASLYLTPEIAQGALLTSLPDAYRWHAAFAVSCVGMLAGLGNYLLMRGRLRDLGSPPDFAPAGPRLYAGVIGGALLGALALSQIIQHTRIAATVVALAGIVVLGVFARLLTTCRPEERGPLAACLILTVQTVIFFLFYQQMSTSLTLFALRNVEHHLLGLAIPPAQFQIFNPLWIMALSPLLALVYGRAGARGRDLSVAGKQALGMCLAALAFFVYAVSARFAAGGIVSAWWLVGGYGLLSASELLISGLGMAMVTRLAPERVRGFTMGAWFLASGIAQYLGSVAASLASVPAGVTDPARSLPLYTRLFLGLGALAAVTALVAFALLPWLNRLMRHGVNPAAAPPLQAAPGASR